MMEHLFERAAGFGARDAVVGEGGRLTYAELDDVSSRVGRGLLAQTGLADLSGARVAFLVPAGLQYVALQWGIWRAGGIAVPLCPLHPADELRIVIEDVAPLLLVAHDELREQLEQVSAGQSLVSAKSLLSSNAARQLPIVEAERPAMILHTSGTTSRPKGVLFHHDTIAAQIRTLVEAWRWRSDDRIVCVLPLHHVHGIINVLCCALWSGATCELWRRFDAKRLWQRFIQDPPLTLFMAVPTIYAKLLSVWEAAEPTAKEQMSRAARRFRLMVSGSSALPTDTLRRWEDATGQVLLERYGMTEIGMALSNPLHGERRAGCVGKPLAGTQTRVVDEQGDEVSAGSMGELLVRGPSVFRQYWRRPAETEAAFSFGDGWFRTGDMVCVDAGVYRIVGRSSVDIIDHGGYKVSALEVEEVLREHPDVRQCAVVGIDDSTYGQLVVAVVAPRVAPLDGLDGLDVLDEEGLLQWCRERLAPYKAPSRVVVVEELPCNAMGKINKSALSALPSMRVLPLT